jgi:Flp pilus assembly protein TadG
MKLTSFIRNRDGGVLITTGLSILFLIGVAGASIDLGQQQLVRARTQQSSDAAALAAATVSGIGVDANQVAMRYFNLNFSSSYMGLTRPMPTINIGSKSIAVSATNTMPPSFVGNIGVKSSNASGRTVVANDSTTTTTMDYDVVAVIDESGSTGARFANGKSRMDEEKDALRDMLDGLFPSSESSNPNLRFGLVGYTGYISTTGGLTSNKGHATSYINKLQSRCHNYDHWGMEAGLNMINGNWSNPVNAPSCSVTRNTSVPPPATLRNDGASLSKAKHVVLITDGYIMVEPPHQANGQPDYPTFVNSCNQVKAAGVIVYTISFVSQGPGDVDALKKCASVDPITGQPRYFFAPDAATLKAILGSVGETIRSIRISE